VQGRGALLDAISRGTRAAGCWCRRRHERPAGPAARFAAKHGLSYPIVYDAGDRIAALYGVRSLPTLVVIDTGGNVVEVHSGYESERALNRMIEPLL